MSLVFNVEIEIVYISHICRIHQISSMTIDHQWLIVSVCFSEDNRQITILSVNYITVQNFSLNAQQISRNNSKELFKRRSIFVLLIKTN